MGENNSMTGKVVNSTLWSFIEAFSRQFITFLLGLVLARLLYPSDYGLIGMLLFFLAICQVFIDCGFANALICKNDRNDKDFSTAFYFNILVGAGAYAILFIIAPYVASFYNEPQLKLLLRVVGLTVFFNSLCIVQNAILTSSMRMRLLTRATVVSQILSGIIGIVLAYFGFGVWALAIQSVGSSVITAIVLWVVTKWWPREKWSKESFKYLWGFGSKMLFVGLISNTYSNIHALVIGKAFNKTDLGLYSKTNNLSRIIPNTLYSVLNKVSLPAFTAIRDNKSRLLGAFRTYMSVAAFIVFPIMVLLVVLADPIIRILWTEKWIAAVPVFQIMCLGCIWNTLDLLSISILQVEHRPDVLLKFEIVNKIIGFLILAATLPLGFYAVIAGRSFYNLYEYLVYCTTNKRFLGYRYREQIKDILPTLLISIAAAAATYGVQILFANVWLKLIAGSAAFSLIYMGMAYLFKLKSLSEVKLVLNMLIYKK